MQYCPDWSGHAAKPTGAMRMATRAITAATYFIVYLLFAAKSTQAGISRIGTKLAVLTESLLNYRGTEDTEKNLRAKGIYTPRLHE
jgi:hypothetical protein